MKKKAWSPVVKMSDWTSVSPEPNAPREAGLIELRATINGKPVPIAAPKAIDTEGILYIKACDDVWHFIKWLYVSLHHPDFKNQHPAAKAYRTIKNAEQIYPIAGLQFRYVTENQLQEQSLTNH